MRFKYLRSRWSPSPVQIIEVIPGQVIALQAPDGSRRRYMVSTLLDPNGTKYELSDHCEASPYYDSLLDERTVLVLKWRTELPFKDLIEIARAKANQNPVC